VTGATVRGPGNRGLLFNLSSSKALRRVVDESLCSRSDGGQCARGGSRFADFRVVVHDMAGVRAASCGQLRPGLAATRPVADSPMYSGVNDGFARRQHVCAYRGALRHQIRQVLVDDGDVTDEHSTPVDLVEDRRCDDWGARLLRLASSFVPRMRNSTVHGPVVRATLG